MDQKALPLFAAPGYLCKTPDSKSVPPTIMSLNAGQSKFSMDRFRYLVSNCNGISTAEKSFDKEFGAAVFTASKERHKRLFSSSRVSTLRTPLVKFLGSIPTKLLTVPVLPPILRRISAQSKGEDKRRKLT